ncbi:MAG: hypothetical protein DHS20C15_30570 [Planctomycetota bacterium]|nr:MAG: hypothetical protein DHS20C15_30570 [Planctomycetota bacterium]
MSTAPSNRDLGPQPLGDVLESKALTRQQLVAASTEQLTHKQVARALKGRWLTMSVRVKVLRALEAATGERFALVQLFNYE